jgi:ParB family transcriptional regulator, chromosome partitioning protein
MPSFVAMNPFRCRMWALHDRLEAYISERTCRDEIESFSRHGQFVPVLGRLLHGDPSYDAELICGARRLFVARVLNKPLAVELRTLSDRDALIAMDTENRLRKDISAYERALSYAQWIRSGHFNSQNDIARVLKISPSQVSRVLRLAQLPAIIVEAFANPTEIREDWGIRLLARLQDTATRHAVFEVARFIVGQSARYPAKEVYRQLLAAAAKGRKLKHRHHDVVVRGENGATLFRIRHQRQSVALLLPLEQLGERTMRDISNAVTNILQAEHTQVHDSPLFIPSKPTVDRLSPLSPKRPQ